MPTANRADPLEDELLSLGDDVMSLAELDGLVAGLLVCPEMILPSAWLPLVLGEGAADGAVFDSAADATRVTGLILAHYNDVAETLSERPKLYQPLMPYDARTKATLWELWIRGFAAAVKLRPGAWGRLREADVETARAYSGFLTLIDVEREDPRFSKIQIDAISMIAHEQIAPWVLTLNRWRLANARFDGATAKQPPHSPWAKTGRNEACPCGSGKKYKKCHGLN